MQPFLNILAWIAHQGVGGDVSLGTGPEFVEAGKWFMALNLASFFLVLGFLGSFGWLIWRRTTRPEPHIQLIMEMDDEPEGEPHPATGGSTASERDREPPPPWEKPADWWKA